MNGRVEHPEMSEEEFEVLDHLYFIISYEQLKAQAEMNDDTLKTILIKLAKNHWLKCYDSKLHLIENSETVIQENFQYLSYLATKAGLMAHNTR